MKTLEDVMLYKGLENHHCWDCAEIFCIAVITYPECTDSMIIYTWLHLGLVYVDTWHWKFPFQQQRIDNYKNSPWQSELVSIKRKRKYFMHSYSNSNVGSNIRSINSTEMFLVVGSPDQPKYLFCPCPQFLQMFVEPVPGFHTEPWERGDFPPPNFSFPPQESWPRKLISLTKSVLVCRRPQITLRGLKNHSQKA